MSVCPVCAGADVALTVHRDRLPTLQNLVHPSRDAALAAPDGVLDLAACRQCGFAWNASFDPARLVYAAGYDNAVPSAVMDDYYRALAERLAAEHLGRGGGLVVDVGCGDGRFLELVCEIANCRGLGIDPALGGSRELPGGAVRLVSSAFAPELLNEAPALVVCRHVLEHIGAPVSFVAEIAAALRPYGPVPAFFEVPDLEWIVVHGTFWDFCYEHCNYFTSASLRRTLAAGGLAEVDGRSAFGNQYLWADAVIGSAGAADEPGDTVERLVRYAAAEDAAIAAARRSLQARKLAGETVAVWGMATKGVLYALLLDRDAVSIDVCIDVNPAKQGRYVPLSGHRIDAPEALRRFDGSALVVIVMNDNYRGEIERTCAELGVRATLVSAEFDCGERG